MREYTVYKHTNIINNKVYFGITCQQVNRRWQNGSGYKGTYFGNAISKYGWENFKHEILYTGLNLKEACDIEKELIKKYNSNNKKYGYNIAEGGQTIVNPNSKFGKDNKKSQRIYCFDENHNFIKEYESQNMAARDLGISRKGITKNCLGISKTYKGYIFEYADKEYIKPIKCERGKHNNHHVRKVNLLNDKEEIIKSYNSIKDALKDFCEDNQSGIVKCCTGKLKSYHGRRWSYGL